MDTMTERSIARTLSRHESRDLTGDQATEILAALRSGRTRDLMGGGTTAMQADRRDAIVALSVAIETVAKREAARRTRELFA